MKSPNPNSKRSKRKANRDTKVSHCSSHKRNCSVRYKGLDGSRVNRRAYKRLEVATKLRDNAIRLAHGTPEGYNIPGAMKRY